MQETAIKKGNSILKVFTKSKLMLTGRNINTNNTKYETMKLPSRR